MIPFHRSARALRNDGGGDHLVLGITGLVMLLGWATWAVVADVPLVVPSLSARIESAGDVHSVQSALEGSVAAVHVALGDPVVAGQVLLDLDAEPVRLHIEEERQRHRALLEQADDISEEIRMTTVLLELEQGAAEARQDVARASIDASRARSRLAKREWDVARELSARGVAADAETETLGSRVRERGAESRADAASLHWVSRAAQVERGELRVRLAQLQARRTELLGSAQVAAASLARLQDERERHRVRSPIEGTIGEVARVQVGGVVVVGDRLASVIPRGGLRITGEFRPADVSGRVKVGAPATMQLEGFSWLRHGFVHARVERVASEARDGTLRVDLAIEALPASVQPHHGLPGVVEIEVDRQSPLQLLLQRTHQAARSTTDETLNATATDRP